MSHQHNKDVRYQSNALCGQFQLFCPSEPISKIYSDEKHQILYPNMMRKLVSANKVFTLNFFFMAGMFTEFMEAKTLVSSLSVQCWAFSCGL